LEQLRENKYATYIKESYNREYFETENGFATFSFPETMPDVCVIHNMWVDSSNRKHGDASRMADKVEEIARECNVKYLLCEIDSRSQTYSQALIAITNYGFKITDTSGYYVVLQKEI